jgi:hypothetical protein
LKDSENLYKLKFMQSFAKGIISTPFILSGLDLSLSFKHAEGNLGTYQLGTHEVLLELPEAFDTAELTTTAFMQLMGIESNVQCIASAMFAQS